MGDQQSDSTGEFDPDIVAEIRENTTDVTSLLGDLYRGEVDRASAWRGRLDQTTNWAVVVVAAILTWAFSSRNNPQYVPLIGILAVAGFLLIEAHRFREYDIWRYRVRLLQQNLHVDLLTGRNARAEDWQAELAGSLDAPTYTMPFREAVGHRLRRTYFPLFLVLLVAWVLRITVFQPGEDWRQTASIPGLDGEVVVGLVAGVYLLLAVVSIWSARESEIRAYRG